MSTYSARIEARLAKQERQLQLAADFNKKVVSPILANILEDGRTAAFPMTLREVREYGRDAVRCFKLMFKLLQRGGRTREGVGFKTHWVVNHNSLRPYIEWTQLEAPLATLHSMLVEASALEMVWNKFGKQWINKAHHQAVQKSRKLAAERFNSLLKKEHDGHTLECLLNVYAKKLRDGDTSWTFNKLIATSATHYGVLRNELVMLMETRENWATALHSK